MFLIVNEVAVPLSESFRVILKSLIVCLVLNFSVFLFCRFSMGDGQRSSPLLTMLEYGTLEQKILIDGI